MTEYRASFDADVTLADRPNPEPAVTQIHLPVLQPRVPADGDVEESAAASRKAPYAARAGELRLGGGHALLNLVGVVPDERIALVIVEAELVRDPPRCFLFQVRQRLAVRGAAEPVKRQVALPPAQHAPRPVVQLPGRKRGTIHGPGGRKRGQRKRRLSVRRSDRGKGGTAHDGGINARPPQCPQNLGCALIEQGDQQMFAAHALAQAGCEQSGGTLSLHMQVGCAVTKGIARRCDDFGQRPASVQCAGGGPGSLGDADEQVDRTADPAKLAGEVEAAPYRL
jgi:hypothetical protein